ncbi:unnamed protein product [Leptosia nina]|uniref:Uncharacterized protein n=1 Tax=Leptosia nina TaxID=320188 RepID=A0AAV1JXV7_9NEOP
MGSAKTATQNAQQNMAEQKKSILDRLKKPIQAIFSKRDKKRKDVKPDVAERTKTSEPVKFLTVSDILDDLDNLKIKPPADEEDEFSNFTCKVIDDKRNNSQLSEESLQNFQTAIRKERNDSQLSEESFKNFTKENEGSRRTKIDSQTSDDSGFSEKTDAADSEDEACEGRRKRIQTVLISRGPIRNQCHVPSHPYSRDADCHQISQVNRQTFSGGQVTVNERSDNTYLNQALELIDTNVRDYTNEDLATFLELAEEFVHEDTNDVLSEFLDTNLPRIIEPTAELYEPEMENPIEALELANSSVHYDTLELFPECLNPDFDRLSVFPTPPRSENVPSPYSDSQVFYPNNSEYSLSPQTHSSSPMYNSDYEKCQDIPSLEEIPSCITDVEEPSPDNDRKRRERLPSASMTMKQYKDLQKEISNEFSKMQCCQAQRKTCKELFEGHMTKLKMENRKLLCQNVAGLELKTAYGVLKHILVSLSNGKSEESLQMALFSLICEKVLALQPELFVQDFGLGLLKLAVLRCFKLPLLTRYLVQCVRTVTKSDAYKRTHECVFTEVDALGDNLVIACARGGDKYANVLYELVRRSGADAGAQPLFTLHHANADGHNALHVACLTHSAQTPHYHTVHVLLEHAGIDLWREDVKGGETALHLAVNSANCDLKLIMIIFKHIDRKLWKKLAHTPNRSSVSPLEYARSASKSSIKQNFPTEVLEFLKKCR